jgi:hypothetical protein
MVKSMFRVRTRDRRAVSGQLTEKVMVVHAQDNTATQNSAHSELVEPCELHISSGE